jgi:hypothetical protein
VFWQRALNSDTVRPKPPPEGGRSARRPQTEQGKITMTTPAAELQKAIFSSLSGDAALVALLGSARIFDQAPANVPFPYITFGRTSVYDWTTGMQSCTEQLFTLHIWSRAKGKKETLDIMELIRRRLDNVSLPLEGHPMVNLRVEFAEARHDDNLSVYHGLLRFRAATEGAT